MLFPNHRNISKGINIGQKTLPKPFQVRKTREDTNNIIIMEEIPNQLTRSLSPRPRKKKKGRRKRHGRFASPVLRRKKHKHFRKRRMKRRIKT